MIATEKSGDMTTIRPEGKITAANAEDLRKELKELVTSGVLNLTIDLAKIDMMDSKGLAVFIVCQQSLAKNGGGLTVVTDNEDFRGLFRVMRLDEHFTVRGSD